ncbi:MAG: hypothetical protein MSH49_06735 [[Eubacterium] saphenum]|nr:hypothetical protein [[Eubacterium] saphenum]
MGEEYLLRAEFLAFKEAMNAENERQNHRILKLEDTTEKINELAMSTEKLASTMEKMLEEQKEQGKRIVKLEGRDGEKWRSVAKIVATAVISAVIGAVLMMIGLK